MTYENFPKTKLEKEGETTSFYKILEVTFSAGILENFLILCYEETENFHFLFASLLSHTWIAG